MQGFQSSKLKRFVTISLVTFLGLIAVNLGLPALLLLVDAPSFSIGEGPLWILRWRNEVDGSGLEFHLFPLLIVALVVGLLSFWGKPKNRH